MINKKIILLCGKSGSGKDYISKALNCNMVISHTTRKIRPNEKNHIDKHFEKRFSKKIKNVIAYSRRGNDEYWITKKDLYKGKVYIIDLKGIKYLKSTFIPGIYFKTVYIKCPLWKRVLNMFKRGENIKTILQRVWIDYKEFKNINDYADVIINV